MTGLQNLRGVGKTREEALRAAGIDSIEALLRFYPLGYRDHGDLRPLRSLYAGMECAFSGRVCDVRSRYIPGKGAQVLCRVEDAEASLPAVWFHAPFMRNILHEGEVCRFFGRIVRHGKELQAVNPSLLKPEDKGISPIYRKIASVGPATLQKLMREALADAASLADPLGEEFRKEQGLLSLPETLRQMHFPANPEALRAAKKSIAFEEMMLLQAALFSLRGSGQAEGIAVAVSPEAEARFVGSLSFTLTGAQRRVIEEIRQDLAAPHAMARLVQGDVGSGKTAVAFAAIAVVSAAGWQSAMMAPTEILARQHYENARRLLEPLGVRCALLTGSLTAAAKRRAQAAIAEGDYDAVFGTHALISEGVAFHKLALAITDEQHRFGVLQRKKLGDKGRAPNVLVMSATPIPRTMSLVLYGDLDLSIIDELPPGRQRIATHLVPEGKLEGMWNFLWEECRRGRQCYVVCPLVAESEELDVADATNMAEELAERYGGEIAVGLLHGKLSAAEKESVLREFQQGHTKILVSTTVVEVGVDVPNATVMVIVDAQRFGLAQLHQLRGRVGRGAEKSYCFLYAPNSERLDILTRTNDGFVIAEKDLELRGPGQLLGLRQSGMLEESAFAMGDAHVLKAAHEAFRESMRDAARRARMDALFTAAARRFDYGIMS